MAKYVTTGIPQKTVGAYLKVIKALNELQDLGEETSFHPWDPVITGLTGGIVQDEQTGEWSFVKAY